MVSGEKVEEERKDWSLLSNITILMRTGGKQSGLRKFIISLGLLFIQICNVSLIFFSFLIIFYHPKDCLKHEPRVLKRPLKRSTPTPALIIIISPFPTTSVIIRTSTATPASMAVLSLPPTISVTVIPIQTPAATSPPGIVVVPMIIISVPEIKKPSLHMPNYT